MLTYTAFDHASSAMTLSSRHGCDAMRTMVQCDFDGTITEGDASFFILDAYARGDWRQLLKEYRERKTSVLEFNTRAFAMVKEDKQTVLDILKDKVRVREGFCDMVDYCVRRGLRFAIVSNGLDFYIDSTLKELGLENVEVHAAQACFHPGGIKVQYIGPDGQQLADGFKEAYIRSFLESGYRVIYMGNGYSDIAPARQARHVFATGELLAYFRENNLEYRPMENFVDVVRELGVISQVQV